MSSGNAEDVPDHFLRAFASRHSGERRGMRRRRRFSTKRQCAAPPAPPVLVRPRSEFLFAPEEGHVRAIARCRWSPLFAGDDAGAHAGCPPRNMGVRYPAARPPSNRSSPSMRSAGDGLHGRRLRGLIVVLWRDGLRINEALAQRARSRPSPWLAAGALGQGRREVGMDEWGWEQPRPWLFSRLELPVGPLFCVISGRTRGRQ